jgi:hypothetical protein
MEIRAVASLCLVVLAGMCFAQESGSNRNSNIACVDRLRLPTYPLLAQQARISGTVHAAVGLSATASPERIEIGPAPNAPPVRGLLKAPVEKAIREAIFKKDCSGKTVELVFVFEIRGDAEETPKQTVSYGFPNIFRIESEAPHFQP